MLLVFRLSLGTGLLAASLALLRVWLQPSTSTRWQRLGDQRLIQQGRDRLTPCSGHRLLPKPASSSAGQANRGTKGIGTGQPQPPGSNARQVAGTCWVVGGVSSIHRVTANLCFCIHRLIQHIGGIGRGIRILPAAISSICISMSLYTSPSETQPWQLSVSLPKGARRTRQVSLLWLTRSLTRRLTHSNLSYWI